MQAEPDGADFIDGDVKRIYQNTAQLRDPKVITIMVPSPLCAQAELVVLGGAFFINGNVNPAAEANIFGDPDAADIVLGGSANTRVVNLYLFILVIASHVPVRQGPASKYRQ